MRKKSAKKAVEYFKSGLDEVRSFIATIESTQPSDSHLSWVHDYGVIRTYRLFEQLVLSCLIAAINSNTETLSQQTGVKFPKHLTDEVCEYIIIGDGYFDFKGRDGLIKILKRYLPDDHYLIEILRKKGYQQPIERLSALRNFAAHDSWKSKHAALSAIGLERISSSGAWLKTQKRFDQLLTGLEKLADEISDEAPY